jgi:hypothetical protein
MTDKDDNAVEGSRREFLKKSAVVGGLAWSMPAVASLPGGRAWAQTYPPACTCTAEAFGMRIIIPPVGFDQTYDAGAEDPPVIAVDTGQINLGALGRIRVQANIVTADTGVPPQGGCHGVAALDFLRISGTALPLPVRPIQTAEIAAEAHASCDGCNTGGGSSVVGLLIGTPPVIIPIGVCNLSVAGLVVVGEQFCTGDVLTVNALHVNIPGIIEVIVGHAEAGATDCPCTTC